MSHQPEVIVVGGGVIGCAVTFELAKRSVAVLLIDRNLPGRASSASAGGLWPVGEAVGLGCGVIYSSAKGQDGPEALPESFRNFLVKSNALFPKLAGELRELSGLDVEFATGAGLLFVIDNEHEQAFAKSVLCSLPSSVRAEWMTPEAVARLEPNLRKDIIGGVLLPGEDQVNPMLLAEAFKRAAIRLGADYRPDSMVVGLRRSGDRIIGVETASEFLTCRTVVNAAGSWSGELAATAGVDLPIFPVRGQIVLTETLPKTLNACLSTSSCYLLQKAHGEVLIGSTTERTGFDVSVTPEAIAALCRGAVRTVPCLSRASIKRVWSGLRPGTPDELPILGPMDGLEGYVNATGGFRTGIVASPLTGVVVAQMISGERLSCPCEAFSANRFHQLPVASR